MSNDHEHNHHNHADHHDHPESGKQLLIDTFHHQPTSRLPWVPFAGAHAAKLKNYTAQEMFQDENKFLECLLEVNKFYSPDGQPIIFDLQIEAEIMGCELDWHEKGPPSVKNHPLMASNTVPSRIPEKSEGRLPFVINVMKKFKALVGDKTLLFGLLCGPLTLAAHLRGTPLFIDLLRNKDYARKLIEYCAEINKTIAGFYIEAGMDVIAIVDPVVSQISPKTFKEFMVEPIQDTYNYIKKYKQNHNCSDPDVNKQNYNGSDVNEMDKCSDANEVYTSFFVCGDATNNLELMCQTGPDSIFVDENIDMKKAKNIFSKYRVILGGNIPLTSVLLYGSQQDNMKYVIDLIDKIGTKDLIIAPGCDMPFDIPIDNVIGVIEAIHQPEKIRKTLADYDKVENDQSKITIELPDYKHLPRPLIEVYTIDSATCAACGYMTAAALDMKHEFGDRIDVIEYKMTEAENLVRMKVLKLKHLPLMMINGDIRYSSIIPRTDELKKEIEKVLKKF
jgi:uroporphyrinogen decarboxylase